MLNVVMLNVVMLNVVAPFLDTATGTFGTPYFTRKAGGLPKEYLLGGRW